MLREWVVGGGGLYGYFGGQGLPVGAQGCLEGFYGGCVDYLSSTMFENGRTRMVI